ncbi:CDP-glycerol glycerophosphotransferase family protein [Staphylococcus gallinarum]|uniref:CDP-glycerol glycerophosphotransferase family protein n=1 Tax=Staphylococcus gallinarum TaxID=1293 RepID=UPI001E3A0E58|nr:CDP-glycerol glycerophosphotransferase family protein [Staphylococcus gallinarum]MCD8826576.1 CDP-glycerol glycerophosphotransferase family protein [Staphylococcus gallinarum]
MNQYIFITSRLDKNHGGLTASLLNKTRIFNEKLNVKPLILTFHLDRNYNNIKDEIIERYNLQNKAEFININEYFRNKDVDTKKVKYIFEPNNQMAKKQVNDSTIEYYFEDEKIYTVKYSNNKLTEVSKFSNGVITEKIILDDDECILSINYYNEGNLESQNLYKKNQSIYENRIYRSKDGKNEIESVTLLDDQKIEFDSFDEFKSYFITLFVQAPLTYLVGEARSIDNSILNIKDSRVRKIFMTHSIHIRPGTDIIRQGNRAVLNKLNEIDALVLLTRSQKKDVINRFGNRDNYFVIPHAIQTENIRQKKIKNKVVVISRLHEEKRIEHAIQAFKQVVEENPSAMLHIYGNGKEKENLHNLIETLSLTNNVKLEGYTNNINEVLQTAECTLLTSSYEGFALVVQESIANGTPVISYDIKYGPSDMIEDDVNGYLVENGNIDQLAKQINAYLAMSNQEKENFSKNALKKAETFSYDHFIDNWKSLFDNVEGQQEIYKPSVKLTSVKLKHNIYQVKMKVNLNAKKIHNPSFKTLYYKRSSLSDRENKQYIETPINVNKINENIFDITSEFNPELFKNNEIYDLSLEIEEGTQYHNIRVGNNRNNIKLNRLIIKGVRPYFTENYGNISFELKSNQSNQSKRKYIKSKMNKVSATTNIPKALIQYFPNKKSENTAQAYQNLKQLHPIFKKNSKYYFNLAKLAIDMEKWKEALHYLDKALEHGLEINDNIHHIKAMLFKKLGNIDESIIYLRKYLDGNPDDVPVLNELIELEIKKNNYTNAKFYLEHILSIQPNDSKAKNKLKSCLEYLEDYPRIIQLAEQDLMNEPDNTKYLLEISNAYSNINNIELAAKYLEKYVKYQPLDKENLMRLLTYFENMNEKNKAIHYLNSALNNENIHFLDESLSAYYYRKGQLEYDLNLMDEAENSYDKAIYYSKDPVLKKWGIGYLHEKSKSNHQAIDAYKKLLAKDDNNADLHFKVATLIKKTGNIEDAIFHFEKALEFNKVRSPWHYQLALCYEEIEDYNNAITAYKNAILRQQTHRPDNFRRLAYILKEMGHTELALDAYNEAELFRKPSYMSKAMYNKHVDTLPVRYAHSYNYYEVDEEMVFYESMGGAGITGNPSAVFDYLYSDKNYASYTHIWVINSFDNIPMSMRDKDNIIFVKKNSDAYLKYIAKAKYLICDSTFSPYVVRKPNQKYLQTTHGIFYKTVGRDSNGSKLGVAGSTRNLLQATHIIAPNQFMVDKQKSAYSIGGIHTGEVAKVGYPRIDVTLNTSELEKEEIKKRMNIDDSKQVVLYAPTWRGETKESNDFDIDKLIYDLKALSTIDANILFRGHSITKSLLKDVEFPENIIIPPGDISTNKLMSVVDILISDYSSVFFDFIPTEKPIIHYVYDIEEYTAIRGLNLTKDELPGYIAENIEDLISSINYCMVHSEPTSKYLQAKSEFCPYDNGESSKNVAKWFFEGNTKNVDLVPVDKYNKKELYLVGSISNTDHINELYENINNSINNGNIMSLSLKKGIAKDPLRTNKIIEMGNKINLLPNAGPMPKTLEEIIAIKDIEGKNRIRNSKTKAVYEEAYQREKRRLFGDICFDNVYNYETDSPYWKGIFSIMKS